MPPSIDELTIADDSQAWQTVGFTIDPDGVARVGTVRLHFNSAANAGADDATHHRRGVTGWTLRDANVVEGSTIDGIPTASSTAPPADPAQHPNGVTHIDHVVVTSGDGPTAVQALESVGLDVRRVRDVDTGPTPIRQTFFRMGEVVIELVAPAEHAGDQPTRIWGLAFTVADLDATVARLGDRVTTPKTAVQPGRRIAALRAGDLDISTAVAFMSV